MLKRPAFWILFVLLSIGAAVVGVRYFPRAFSIVALNITMDRGHALERARAIVAQEHLGPAGYRQAASFALDEETQTFVELEGGGKEAFTRMLRDGLYAAYTWRVRQFREGETNETTIRFTPDGTPYGFVERLPEDAPGAALDAAAARRIAEATARTRWQVDLAPFALVEQAQERRPGNRVDHTFTYERGTPTLNEGRYRLRLVVSGDRLTAIEHFVKIPEAFSRRYENMRSANEAIGIGSVVGMALLYVFGGIGAGLFFMLRRRYVLWRQPLAWGVLVALLQALAAINEWPLVWMSYDTAVPRATFFAQQAAVIGVTFVGFSLFFGLSFMAAETLTRAAFGRHPQLWRVWSAGPGSSTAVLARTATGFLLVPAFFAYDVMLYLFATRVLGWWSPAEALLHPDVLATYAPWLSAIANSLQAGFWEECLFRAVPLAGAALIGDRFGRRRLFLVIAFIVQAAIFGAGHAPYPNQPAFARPVELILPSIGFGLIYVYLGLLPGIILHFAFDVVWFALPIFLADAPGIRFQQVMVAALTLVPLWIVLARRVQAGRWTELSPADRNAAWTAPPPVHRATVPVVHEQHVIGPRARTIWFGLGALGLAACAVLAVKSAGQERFGVTRAEAAARARSAIEQRGGSLGPAWRVMPVPDDGSGGAHEFVSDTAGEPRRRELLGRYLPEPRWRVRIARFQGDVADRAEEWQVFVSRSGEVGQVSHTLPESRPGASLDEAAARVLARSALRERAHVDPAQAREVSARPSKLAARTDWSFTFADTAIALPQGEPRIDVDIAGDEVASVGRYVHVPEEWSRRERAAGIRATVVRILTGTVFGGLLLTTAVLGVIAWSRHRYSPILFLSGAALMLLASVANAGNRWPAMMAALSTAAPLPLQLAALAGVGLIGLGLVAALVGLVLGGMPSRIASSGMLPPRDAVLLGVSAGCVAAAAMAAAAWLRTPEWAQTPDLAPLGTFVPPLDVATSPVSGFLTRLAVLLALFTGVDAITAGWTRRRVFGIALLAVAGALSGTAPIGSAVTGWLAAGALMAVALAAGYVLLLRADLSMLPLVLGTTAVIAAVGRGAQRTFPGAFVASIAAALVIAAVAWLWFRGLRRAADRARAATPAAAAGR